MRVRFAEGDDAVAREELIRKIDAWWREFESRIGDLNLLFQRKQKWDLPAWMAEHLGGVDLRLMWEFGPASDGGNRLVITPESAQRLRPLTQLILDRAPDLPEWSLTSERREATSEAAIYCASQRTGFPLDTATVKAILGKHGRIDVAVLFDDAKSAGSKDAKAAAFYAVEYLCGEICLNHWIGAIEAAAKPRKSMFRKTTTDDGGVPLGMLPDVVSNLIEKHRETLPPRPLYELAAKMEYTLWKLDPEEGDDCAGQADLYVGTSCCPEMWTATRQDHLFCSERFTRFGETFCYLKIDGSKGLESCEFDDKAGIEDAVDEVLIDAKLGCTIGGGTGWRYSYVDLALTDPEPAIHLLKRRFANSGFPARTWILFYDRDLSAEWVGINAETPEPLLTAEEE